ncbi:Gfo/Idh/MocA family oxidoreductase [Litorilinea aerophila]|uniref:Gfo/Idh/MocA family protein n=1 Tax=Litorilinea aerophila TaxID=1204385 RepID=UPI001B85E6E0|nr:Gfo/Idh/MocA family oxidoreductase [Litorilinea aerophila]MCC9076324.1 Gfo/Idh/MocA family oxidoreductase [Litorilinea aerophila]GIV78058.1 MAG: oxidoreductase [Litorilinea sp.]
MSESTALPRIRVGVIGVGQIGKRHLQNYSGIEGAEVVAIADINEAEAKRVGALFGIPNVYTDFRQLLARDDIDAVDVCLHNNFHMPVTVAALEAGKHVFCEKPMAGSYVDAARMLETAERTGRKLSIQIQNLFDRETKAAKALIDGGHLGRLYHARSTGHRRRGRPFVDGYGSPTFVQKQNAAGGALYDMGVYHISTILYLLGNPAVERISGKTYQELEMDEARRELSGYNVEELGLGFVRMADGITLDIIEAWAIQLDTIEGSSVVGTRGGVRLKPFGYFHTIGDLDLVSTADLDRFQFRLHTVRGHGDAYDGPQQHWIAALQGRVELLPTAQLALNTMLISEGIYLSNQLGREVTADEVREASVSTAVMV